MGNKSHVEYIIKIIDHYPDSRKAAEAICEVIAGIESAKDAVIRDREEAINHLRSHR